LTTILVRYFKDDTDRMVLMISDLLTNANARLDESPALGGGPFSVQELMPLLQYFMDNGRIIIEGHENNLNGSGVNGKIYMLV
jgi:hypothetical protein